MKFEGLAVYAIIAVVSIIVIMVGANVSNQLAAEIENRQAAAAAILSDE